MVRYRVKPEQVETNEALVRAVYAELAEKRPPGFRYETFKLDDGVTFVHLAMQDGEAPSALSQIDAFAEFQKDVRSRCDEPPVAGELEPVGAFGLH
jgi:hypothetical protein